MVYLTGGLAHQDTFDLKPNAPAEVRGEFKPIPTNVPGVQFGEHLPKLAKCMDKLVVIRSLVGQRDEHSSWQSITGTTMDAAKRENKPHFGSVVARMQGQTDPVIPAFVDLSPTMQHKPYNTPGPANLGRAAAPVKVDGDEIAVMKNLAVTPDQLRDRKALLDGIDAFRKSTARRTRPGRHVPRSRLRRAHVEQAGRSARRDEGTGRASATATARARRSTSATARRCGTINC